MQQYTSNTVLKLRVPRIEVSPRKVYKGGENVTVKKMEGEKRGDGYQVNGDQVKYSFGRGSRPPLKLINTRSLRGSRPGNGRIYVTSMLKNFTDHYSAKHRH